MLDNSQWRCLREVEILTKTQMKRKSVLYWGHSRCKDSKVFGIVWIVCKSAFIITCIAKCRKIYASYWKSID